MSRDEGHRSGVLLLSCALLVGACGGRGGPAGATDRGAEGSSPPTAGAPLDPPAAPQAPEPDGVVQVRAAPAMGVEIPDEELVDQDGAPVRLRELAKDRVLAVNFIFTACTTICSPMTAIFSRLQAELGHALERDVRLVSISLDPAVDTSERLKRYADPFNRRRGWVFLTGSRERVVRVLDALGGRAPVKERHTPVTLIGRAAEGRWTRVDGIASPARLAEEIRAFLPPEADREARGARLHP